MSRGATWIVAVAAVSVAVGVGAAARTAPPVAVLQAPVLPDDAAKATVQRMCGTACHDLTFLIGRRETSGRWGEIVEDMSVRGAPGNRQDIEAVVGYLSKHFGRTAAAPATPSAAPSAVAPAAQSPRTSRACATTPRPRCATGHW